MSILYEYRRLRVLLEASGHYICTEQAVKNSYWVTHLYLCHGYQKRAIDAGG